MRETYGPDFDDRLIRLVRDNPAIYDVNHEHYRRYQVRVAIWERIASEMRTSSKFLQTKWKNIRYNYLQEVKSLETGLANANIRKRRFTEDLSFLQNTAQAYKKVTHMNSSYNSSDNDSNSYMYSDPQNTNTFEIIEIEHSDDDNTALEYAEADYSGVLTDVMHHQQMYERESISMPTDNDYYDNQLLTELNIPTKIDKSKEIEPDATIEHRNIKSRKASATIKNDSTNKHVTSTPPRSNISRPSTPMLTPIVAMGKEEKYSTNVEVTLQPIVTQAKSTRQPSEIMSGATKRKAMPAPFPVLTPINDPIELYCLSLVDSLRNMPRAERERVKFEFSKILKDAKYKDQS